eukprot:5505808-Alexandrium_andersonii.AAC.1
MRASSRNGVVGEETKRSSNGGRQMHCMQWRTRDGVKVTAVWKHETRRRSVKHGSAKSTKRAREQ